MRRTLIVSGVASATSAALVVSTIVLSHAIDDRHAATTMNLNAAVRKVAVLRGFIPELSGSAARTVPRLWQRQLAELTPILAKIPAFNAESGALKARILEENEAIGALFANLSREAAATAGGDREIVAGQLDVRTASMASDILAINDLAATYIIRQKSIVLVVMASAVATLAAVIVALLIVLQRRVVSPVLRLQRAVARFSGGESDEPIEISGTSEVTALATGFDFMRQSLRQRMAELDAARSIIAKENETLAQRVEQSTAELRTLNRELQQAGQAKDLFLATMSHEIRTPMNGVVGLVEVLAHSELSEHQADLVTAIRQSAATLLAIIDDILDYSKIEAGRLDIEYKPLSIADLTEGLCTSLMTVAASRGVDLSVYVSPEVPELVLSDDLRLRQVIYNLIGNAIKFSAAKGEKRGRVDVRVEVVEEASPLLLSFRISDNGIGMAPDTLKRLFLPFTQGEASTTRLFGGTGLGLTICRRLVTLMNGEIKVESELGAGATFTVVLPFELPAEQPAPILPDISGVACVIVASATRDFANVRSYLEHAGAQVHVAADVAEAATQAASLAACVVVQGVAPGAFSADALHRAFAAAPGARHLVLMPGDHTHVRVRDHDVVVVEGNTLRRKPLLRAVAVAAGRSSPEAVQPATANPRVHEVTPPSTEEARAAGRLILVAEDDELNQKVIIQQLELLGYAQEMAGDGEDALRMWRDGSYGLLLTDLHMPKMDGYTLAESIRQTEDAEHRPHTPIIALTANALRGEMSRIKSAGMDDYLTKPVPLKLLDEVLRKWLPAGAGARDVKTGHAEVAVPADLDLDVLRTVVGGDSAVMRDFLGRWSVSASGQMKELREALGSRDFARTAAIAHRLKSPSRSVGALRMGALCAELEELANSHNDVAAAERLALMEDALSTVTSLITDFLKRP